MLRIMVKVKLSRYRSGQALGVPGGLGSRISRQSAHKGGKVVSPTHRPSLLPGFELCKFINKSKLIYGYPNRVN
jgi:hypothetical protein